MSVAMLEHAACANSDILSAVHFKTKSWKLITMTADEYCFAKCSCPADTVCSSSSDNALTCNEDEENEWHSVQYLGVQFEDSMTCDSAVEVCGVQNVHQVLDQQLTRQEKESEVKEKEEVAEDTTTLLGILKALELARQYMFQFDWEDSTIIMC
jgi:hypothetical protein